jgi:hypothetical protein
LISYAGKVVEKMNEVLSNPSPPELVLNNHCPECEFRDRCRRNGIDKNDLSLLANLTERERSHFNRKGIFTVHQLSSTFRPRRKSALHSRCTNRAFSAEAAYSNYNLEMADDASRPEQLDIRLVLDTIPTLAWSSHPDGSVDFVNQHCVSTRVLSAEESYGCGWKTAIHPNDLPVLSAKWEASLTRKSGAFGSQGW